MSMPASSSASRPPISIAGVGCEGVAVGDEVVFVAVRAGMRKDPTILRHTEPPGRLDRAHDHCGGHVDLVVRVQQLRVREPDHPVVGGDGRDLLGRLGLLDPGVRVACSDLAEFGVEATEVVAVFVDRAARCRPDRGLEHRVDLHRHEDATLGLGLEVHLQVVADDPRFVTRFGLRPVEFDAGTACSLSAPRRFAAREHGDVDLARLDLDRRRVDQRLGAVAAHGGVVEVARCEPEALGKESRGVAVAPRELPDDAHRVGHRRPVEAGVGRCGEYRLLHQRHRFHARRRATSPG